MSKIFVTGANGFIGRALCQHLVKLGVSVRGAVRFPNIISNSINYECISVGNDIKKKN